MITLVQIAKEKKGCHFEEWSTKIKVHVRNKMKINKQIV